MATARVKASMDMDASRFNRGVGSAETRISKLKGALGGMAGVIGGAFAVGAVTKFIRAGTQYGSMISDIATQTGLATDAVQTFEVAALNAGATVEQARKGMISLRDAQGDAIAGNKMMEDAFNRLGISTHRLAETDMQELVEMVGKGMAETNDFAAAVDILGKRNAGVLEEALLRLGNNGFQATIDKAKEAGDVLRDDFAASLDSAEDAIQRFERGKKKLFGTDPGRLQNLGTNDVREGREILLRQEAAADRSDKARRTRLRQLDEAEAKRELAWRQGLIDDVAKATADRKDKERKQEIAKEKTYFDKIKSLRDRILGNRQNIRDMSGNVEVSQLRAIGANVIGNGQMKPVDREKIELARKQLRQQEMLLEWVRNNPGKVVF